MSLQTDRATAHTTWLAAAGVGGSHQAPAFAKLGLWYTKVKADSARARKCFQRSLGLDPLQAEAGIEPTVVSCMHLHMHIHMTLLCHVCTDICTYTCMYT